MKRANKNLKKAILFFKIITVFFIVILTLNSCVVEDSEPIYVEDNSISLNQLLQTKDLWYLDYNATQGNGDTRFLSLAFTISFKNGKLYANNNLVGIGNVGSGFGDQIGFYSAYNNTLTIDHDLDGVIDLEVIQTTNNRIKLKDHYKQVTYSLIGYNKNIFDYDQVFYDNIEYFLQEYVAWKKTDIIGGVENDFDSENFLAFIPDNGYVFNSSQDNLGTNIADVLWDFSGEYEVFDVQGYEDLKILTLDYDLYGNEEFELSVLDDGRISLYHNSSDTTYEFDGKSQIIFKNSSVKKDKKRFKVNRKTKVKKQHVTKKSNR